MDNFFLRRAIERLRDGLFDLAAVNLLTMDKDRVEGSFSKGLKAVKDGKSDHLCICGSYGQGKSHTLNHLNQVALAQGYATSVVQLDLREVPFYRFSTIYQSIMERLFLPDGKKFINAWKSYADKAALELLKDMPHRFRMVLTAMLCKNKQLTPKQSSLKKNQNYSAKEYDYWLSQALMGYDIPNTNLKQVCKYREIKNYQEQSFICRGNDNYFQMIESLGNVLNKMGYKGLVLFFDEAESITQVRLSCRLKSYNLLDRFFQTKNFVFPVFAFTHGFFDKVKSELYDENKEIFPKNYAEAWKDLNILYLQDFSSHGWELFLDRFMQIYSEAYQVDLPSQAKQNLQSLLTKLASQETRVKLKALVNKLDIETQQVIL